jgi:hypothetical protein
MNKHVPVSIMIAFMMLYAVIAYTQSPTHKPSTRGTLALPERVKYSSTYSYSTGTYLLEDTVRYGYVTGNGIKDHIDTVTVYRKNSGNLVPYTREIYTYTPSVHLYTGIIRQSWDNTSLSWRSDEVTLGTYIDTNLSTQVTQLYDAATHALVNRHKEVNIYNANGQLTSQTEYQWSTSSQAWWASLIITNTYTGSLLTSFLNSIKDSTGALTYRNQTDISYTGSLPTKRIGSKWDIAKSVYIYDIKDSLVYAGTNLTGTHTFAWDTISKSWLNWFRVLNQYTGANITQTIRQGGTLTGWENTSRSTYQFVNGDETEGVYENWNKTTAVWDKYYRTLRAYDANHIELSFETNDWSKTQNAWQKSTLTTSTNNTNGSLTVIAPFAWDSAGSRWVPDAYQTKNYYYYENYTPTALVHLSDAVSAIILYPNPVNNQLNILLPSADSRHLAIRIYDLAGSVVSTHFYPESTAQVISIQVSDLPTGIYQVAIYDHEQLLSTHLLAK